MLGGAGTHWLCPSLPSCTLEGLGRGAGAQPDERVQLWGWVTPPHPMPWGCMPWGRAGAARGTASCPRPWGWHGAGQLGTSPMGTGDTEPWCPLTGGTGGAMRPRHQHHGAQGDGARCHRCPPALSPSPHPVALSSLRCQQCPVLGDADAGAWGAGWDPRACGAWLQGDTLPRCPCHHCALGAGLLGKPRGLGGAPHGAWGCRGAPRQQRTQPCSLAAHRCRSLLSALRRARR